MRLMGFNFTKINIEKLSENTKDLKIKTNIDILDITKTQTDLFKSKEDFLGIKFNHTIEYEPNFAKLELAGNILISIDSKTSKELLKKWEEKKISDEIRIPLFNLIMRKSAVKALELEDEMNIPYHIPMPTLKNQED